MTPYDQGYKCAVRHAYEAAGLAITIPLDEDILFAHLREMRKYRQGYESIQHERDHARECERKANDRQAVLAMVCNDLLDALRKILHPDLRNDKSKSFARIAEEAIAKYERLENI